MIDILLTNISKIEISEYLRYFVLHLMDLKDLNFESPMNKSTVNYAYLILCTVLFCLQTNDCETNFSTKFFNFYKSAEICNLSVKSEDVEWWLQNIL